MTDPNTRCSTCKGPWHQASGFVHNGSPVCGACTRNFLDWWKKTLNRKRRVKVDGKTVVLRFYDHAFPPGQKDQE